MRAAERIGRASAGVVLGALVAVTAVGCEAAEGPAPGLAPSPTAGLGTPGPDGPSPSSASTTTSPTQQPTAEPAPPSPTPPSTTVLGPTLRQLGFANGPLDTFSVPSGALTSATVDQPNVVTLVFERPDPVQVEAYYRRVLPAGGFVVSTESPDRRAFTFAGYGWSGSFTAAAATSAVVLRPT